MMEGLKMNGTSGEAERRERIMAALARYEANGKAKRGKLFSVDRHEPQQEGEERRKAER